MRSLPPTIARLLRAGAILNTPTKISIILNTELVDLRNTSTKAIRKALMSVNLQNLAVDLNKIHKRRDFPSCDSEEFANSFANIWKIKHPTL